MNEPDAIAWQRLHPRMLVLHPFRAALDLAPAVLLAVVVGTDIADLRLVVGVAVGLVVLSLARWWTTTYALLPASVEQRSGVLLRRRRSVPRHRIRSADVEAPLLQRLLGLRILRLTTASSASGTGSGGTVVLNAVAPADAARLVAALDVRPPVDPAPDAAPSEDQGTAPVEETTPDEEVAEHPPTEPGLVDWRPWWAVYAPFSASGFVVLGGLGIFVAQFLTDLGVGGALTSVYLWLLDRMSWQAVLGLAVASCLVLAAVLAAGTYLLSHWRFQVVRSRGVLRVTRGLLSRRAVTLDLDKLRGVERTATLPVRALGGASTHTIMTGLGVVEQGATSTLLPLAPAGEGARVATSVLGTDVQDLDLPRHGPVAARRRLVRAVLGLGVWVAVVGGLWWAVTGSRPEPPTWVLVVLAALVVAMLLVGVDRYRRLGHRVDPVWVRTREGSLNGRTVVLRTEGVIGVVVRQTPFQRRSGVATMTLATAAGKQGYRVLDLPAGQVAPDLDVVAAPWWSQWRGDADRD